MRTFILGMGAQKSGTSWLYDQIGKSESFKAPAIKELHILDSIYIDACSGFRKNTEIKFSKALLKGKKFYENLFITKQFQMLLDQDEYFKYYDKLMNEDNCFSSDITPSYAALPIEALQYIRSKFSEISIEMRIIFLMREPVTRLESAIRMNLRLKNVIEETTTEEMMKKLKSASGSEGDRLRSSYRDTVGRIRSCFEEDQIHLGFYETMFETSEIDRLGKFLKIDPRKFDVDKKVNETSQNFKYPREFVLELKENYLDNYAFATEDLSLSKDIWDSTLKSISE